MTVAVTTNRENIKCFGSRKHFSYSPDRCSEGKRHFLTKTLTSKLRERKGASMTCEGGCEINSTAHWDLAEGQRDTEL